jgi:phage terminase large subunit
VSGLVVISDGLVREERHYLEYIPRPQFIPFHKRTQRRAVIVAHRRAGKTVACILDLIQNAVELKRDEPRFAYVAPLYKQAKTVAWDYLKKYGLRIPGATANESELRVDIPPFGEEQGGGARIRLYGADNPDALRGIYLDGVVLDEVAQMSPRVYQEILGPTLVDRQGWVVFIGTPQGQNDFYDLIYGTKDRKGAIDQPDRYFFQMLKASETGILPKEYLDEERREMTPAQYLQEYECSFVASILGAYYSREMEAAEAEGRIGKNIYDRTLQVHTAWDLGHSDSTAIWFYQQSGFEIRVIDFYSASNFGLDHYVSMLRDRSTSEGYLYGKHYLPHDVKVKELSTGKDRVSSLRAMGLDNIQIVAKLGIDDGINAVRKILPRCWFEREKCQDGLKALRQYRREYDDVRKVFYEKPHHDWASDPADAFRYLAVGLREPTSRSFNRKPEPAKEWIY